jgi:CheY-like chemotaxis protein
MASLHSGVRILLVDDDEDTLQLCMMVFSMEGADVRAVDNARDAYDLLRGDGFDVLVSDIAMPRHDGYWLIEQVRALESDVRTIPALALSAHALATDRQDVLTAGYQLHVAKPVEPRELVAAVQSLLE